MRCHGGHRAFSLWPKRVGGRQRRSISVSPRQLREAIVAIGDSCPWHSRMVSKDLDLLNSLPFFLHPHLVVFNPCDMDSQAQKPTRPAGEACAKLLNLTGLDAEHFAVLARCPDDTSRKYAKLNPFHIVLHLVETDASKIQQLVPDLDMEPTVAEMW